jgi:hypothetical protein
MFYILSGRMPASQIDPVETQPRDAVPDTFFESAQHFRNQYTPIPKIFIDKDWFVPQTGMRKEIKMENLDEVTRRPVRYLSEDGVPDLMLGLNSLLVGVIFLIAFELPKGSSVGRYYIFLAQILWGCCIFGMRWGITTLRRNVTFPRGGYVALANCRVSGASVWALRFLRVACVVLVTLMTEQVLLKNGADALERFAIPLITIGMALAMSVASWRYKLPYMQWLALFSLLLGACVYPFRQGGAGICWMLIGLGAAIAFGGVVRLRGFMASHPLPAETI